VQHVEVPVALRADETTGITKKTAEKSSSFAAQMDEIDPALQDMTRCDRYVRSRKDGAGGAATYRGCPHH
jgi:hypothetical protein